MHVTTQALGLSPLPSPYLAALRQIVLPRETLLHHWLSALLAKSLEKSVPVACTLQHTRNHDLALDAHEFARSNRITHLNQALNKCGGYYHFSYRRGVGYWPSSCGGYTYDSLDIEWGCTLWYSRHSFATLPHHRDPPEPELVVLPEPRW